MKAMFIRLHHEEHGAVMAEHALLAALIAAVAVAAARTFGGEVSALFQTAVAAFSNGSGMDPTGQAGGSGDPTSWNH